MTELQGHTARQIAALALDPVRPLVLCDVDEVVVHFLRGLEMYLEARGLWLDPASFALNGNIRHRDSGAPLEEHLLGPALMDFFSSHTHELDEIDEAAASLDALAPFADIVMLTNLPDQFRDARIVNLAGHGIHFPVVTNSGPKGPAVAAIARDRQGPVIFLDDHVGYLESAAAYWPGIHLIHFMQDARFARHAPVVEDLSLRTDNWRDARAHILRLIEAA